MFPNYYQPPYYPAQIQMPQMPEPRQNQQPQQNNNGLIWVQGEAGAKSYPVAPGSTVMLMDSEESRFYIKSADGSGMPQPLRIFDYTERTAQSKQPEAINTDGFVSRAEFEELKALVNGLTEKEEEHG